MCVYLYMNANLEMEFKFCLKKGFLQAASACNCIPRAIQTAVSFAISFTNPPWQLLHHHLQVHLPWGRARTLNPGERCVRYHICLQHGWLSKLCVFMPSQSHKTISSLNRNPSLNLFLDKLQKIIAILDT